MLYITKLSEINKIEFSENTKEYFNEKLKEYFDERLEQIETTLNEIINEVQDKQLEKFNQSKIFCYYDFYQ